MSNKTEAALAWLTELAREERASCTGGLNNDQIDPADEKHIAKTEGHVEAIAARLREDREPGAMTKAEWDVIRPVVEASHEITSSGDGGPNALHWAIDAAKVGIEEIIRIRTLGTPPTDETREPDLSALIELERTVVARGIHGVEVALHGFQWLTEGRGSHEWDDDRWYAEFSNACEKIREALEPLRRIAADLADCPKDIAGRHAAVAAFLSQPPVASPPEGGIAKAAQKLIDELQQLDCKCSVAEVLSGHLTDCHMPWVRDAENELGIALSSPPSSEPSE